MNRYLAEYVDHQGRVHSLIVEAPAMRFAWPEAMSKLVADGVINEVEAPFTNHYVVRDIPSTLTIRQQSA